MTAPRKASRTKQDPCGKCAKRSLPCIMLKPGYVEAGDMPPCARSLVRRVSKLDAINHDLRQKVYCAGHRCIECGYMVGMGYCTFRWKAARIRGRK